MSNLSEQFIENLRAAADEAGKKSGITALHEIAAHRCGYYEAAIMKMHAAMQRFVDKVESGRAHSVETYGQFKEILRPPTNPNA